MASMCPECKRGEIVMVDAFNGGAVDYDFICSLRCGWECADPERAADYRASVKAAKKKAAKKKPKIVKFVPDSPELVQAIRAECDRRMEIIMTERAKFPPTFTTKGKPNKKFTEAMRVHMHTFAYTADQVREELLK